MPTYLGDRLDWCQDWGGGCGKQAADAYCRHPGYRVSVSRNIDHNIGAATPTRVISTGAVCDQGFCDGFKYISCSH